MLQMDMTNRYAWGKVMVRIGSIVNFAYKGTLLVRLTLKPWMLNTKRIIDNKLDFN